MTLIYIMFGTISMAAFGAAGVLAFKLDLVGNGDKKTGTPKPPTFEALQAPKRD